MQIGVIGVNHKSAKVVMRELLAKACQKRFGLENAFHPNLSYVLLSTCNRTELYFCSDDLAQTHSYIFNILRHDIEEEFEHSIYSYFGSDCFFHLACVTAGVDSAIVGETEIQGQVKLAYERAAASRKLSKELHFLFQKSLKIGKEVRTTLLFTRGLPTLEEAVLNASRDLLGDLSQKQILFVGLSDINHTIFKRFKKKGFCNISFCNRTDEKAQQLAEKEGVSLLPWEKLSRWAAYDLVVFGTKCPQFLAEHSQLPDGLSARRLVIDLSVPRNVDPRVGRHKQCTLLNIDQLNRAIDRKRRIKAAMLARVETQVIARSVERQVSLFLRREHLRHQALLTTA